MIIVRFKATFRERAAEWICSVILMCWGFQVLQPYPLFNRPFFKLLADIAPEAFWGWSAFLIGLGRVVVLLINGAWRRSPFLRQCGCAFGLMVWLALFLGAGALDYGSPGWAPYLGLFSLDVLSLSFAAADGASYASRRTPPLGLTALSEVTANGR